MSLEDDRRQCGLCSEQEEFDNDIDKSKYT